MSSLRSFRSALPRPFADPDVAIPLLSGGWIAAVLAGTVLVDLLLLASAGLRIDLSWTSIGFVIWGIAAMALCYALRSTTTPARRFVRDLTEGVSVFALISLLGAVASYPLAAGGHGLVDAALERIDLGLHFHWIDWYATIADHPWLQPLERSAYLSIFVTPALLLGYFAWTGRRAESRLFIATFWVAALITLSLFPLLPAAGPFATLWHGTAPYVPVSALYQIQMIDALRHHAIGDIDLGALHGLVCAPSFHAASAVIYLATAWRVAPLRWPLTVLNLAMLLATPVEGTHYLTDVLCGMIVACVAIGLTPLLIRLSRPAAAIWSRRHPVAAE